MIPDTLTDAEAQHWLTLGRARRYGTDYLTMPRATYQWNETRACYELFSSPRLAAALAARHPAPIRSVPCGAGRRPACRAQRWTAAGAAVGGLPVARGEKCVVE